MKSIIVIGAYCPDDERKQLLENCINSLQPFRKDFDILISSHLHIPKHIIDKVDYYFYDKNNELITDWDLMNLPWFSPYEGLLIVSSLISNYSVYLAAYRAFIGALGIAKNFGYKKVHYLDYDSLVTDVSDFYDNEKLLEKYVGILYKKEYKNYEHNVEGGVGVVFSLNLDKVPTLFTEFNKSKLLDILKNSPNKTNELITPYILQINCEKILYKDFNEIINKGNIFNQSGQTQKDDLDDWTVPFYDTKTGKLNVIVWNSKKDYPINVNFLFNKEKITTINNINKWQWKIEEVDDINNINEILIIVDNKIKNHILINTPELKEKFIRNNQTQYE